MIPDHYSFTQMSVYHDCHRKYYMKYVLGYHVPVSVRALEGELFHRRIAGATAEEIRRDFVSRSGGFKLAAKDTPASILGGIETAYSLYRMWESGHFPEGVMHELDISTTVGRLLGKKFLSNDLPYPSSFFEGILEKEVKLIADIIVPGEGGTPASLIDVKLRTKVPDAASCRDELQVGMYSLACAGVSPALAVLNVSYSCGGSLALIKVQDAERVREEARYSLLSAVVGISSADFSKTPGPFCAACEYAPACEQNTFAKFPGGTV